MDDSEFIEVVGEDNESEEVWNPVVGEEATAMLERTLADQETRLGVLQSSHKILGHCSNPLNVSGAETGLIVGYVQSGKTLSFTTVAALANDNNFGLVVVVAGMTNDLANQSYRRLLRDLGIEETPFNRWAEFLEPSTEDFSRIRDILSEAQDETVPFQDRRTVIIVVKKNHTRLDALNNLLARLGPLIHVPSIIIDDEADQASLNNLVRDGQLSTTYRRLRELRDLLPHHAFLQYTATPQAPLLINLIDVLSPDFPVVIEPGQAYTGGTVFFEENTPYVEEIPVNEIPTPAQPLSEPPESLLRALQLFFVGVASGGIRRAPHPRNRSMMVHSSRETVGHVQYHTWVQAARNFWIDCLTQPADDEDRVALLEEFRGAYDDLARTVDDLESFENIANALLHAIRNTDVRMVNSLREANREIHWNRNYSWILVGGQVLDRGFTVEGLTVTYMPRGPGVGNADTIQQRARFFGYKRSYLGFCRVFLESAVSDLFRRYVVHEEDVRNRLIEHINSGKPLSAFRRAFLLDRSMRPTRQAIIDVDYVRPNFRNGWCSPNSPHEADLETNNTVIDSFIGDHAGEFVPDKGHPDRKEGQLHLVATGLLLRDVYEELLTQLSTRDFEDSQKWTAALLMISNYLEATDNARCTVFQMRPEFDSFRRVRDGRIVNLFQGPHPDSGGAIYPGDRQKRIAPVTVHLHKISLRDGPRNDSPIIAENVRFAAIWLASEALEDVVIQPQGGDD